MKSLRNSLLVLAALLAPAGFAAQDDAVVVNAVRDPVDKSYRKMMDGAALFERMRHLAPAATLRYKLYPRKRTTRMDNIQLAVVGDSFMTPVDIAADHTFALERDSQALRENASVRPDRKAGTMTWRADVRSPGVPEHARRLGDLRLECRVGMQAALISRYPSVIGRMLELFGEDPGSCDKAPYLVFAERPLFAATLVHGARRQALSVGDLYAGVAHGDTPKEDLPHCDCEVMVDRAYSPPLGDRRWPDDTLVVLEYMDAPSAEGPLPAGMTKEQVRAAFGPARATSFESGHEVWSYGYGPDKRPRRERAELVVLFSPSGTVAKSRTRLVPPD